MNSFLSLLTPEHRPLCKTEITGHTFTLILFVQADAGAQAVQIFDSWASELQPQDFDVFAGPYIQKIIDSVRKSHPDLTIILYISGSGGLLERMAACRPDVVSVDQRVDMADAIQRIGPDFAVQVELSQRPCIVMTIVNEGLWPTASGVSFMNLVITQLFSL